ncbi:cyclophilin type peptidyl-prolyl cis-trans isomerase/CLD domain-containing protein [Ditylenchus destructor]|nr:cyclophilin type peptidyl-prolyl cis-trans isomerase/CLD domain-containing protein [Ditylenchus destructor]
MFTLLSLLERSFHPTDKHGVTIPYSELNPRVYFQFTTEYGDELGTVDFRLLASEHPKLVENFCKLCTGKKDPTSSTTNGKTFHYKGTPVHAICANQGLFVAGDVLYKNGCGGHAADAAVVVDEVPSSPPRLTPGTLCMQNCKPGGNEFDSRFFVIVDPSKVEKLNDGVVFGYAEKGLEVLEGIMNEGTANGTPRKKISITDCGLY